MKKALLPLSLILLLISIFLINNFRNNTETRPVDKKELAEEHSKFKMESEHEKIVEEGKFDEPNKFAELHRMLRTRDGDDGPKYVANYKMKEFLKAKRRKAALGNSVTADLNWIERGPANVGGRTRGLIVDPDDPSGDTWFAGSVGGGVWKTTDAGTSWLPLTDDLPALSTTVLAMAGSNHDVMYAGTGEGFGNADGLIGQGIFKSTDKGETWVQLASTAVSDFFYVNRIVVDPSDEDILLAATNVGIFKSTDGGVTWDEKYSSGRKAQHIIANPKNFNTLYCAINGLGVVKSKDAGDSWFETGEIKAGGRFEIALAPSDTNRIYAANESSILFMTVDGGQSWLELEEEDGSSIGWLGSQGWYDNTIAVSPYNEDIVFMGGIDIWKSTVTLGTVLGISDVQTGGDFDSAFVPSYVGLSFLDGAVGTGNNYWTEIVFNTENLVDVELRTGSGVHQMAHRFLPTSYAYQDYVDIPFEAWDVTNNKQLAISFVDIDRNGEFNLRLTRGDVIFIHDVDYDANGADVNIGQDVSGIKYENMYVVGLKGQIGVAWDAANLPTASVNITTGDVLVASKNSEAVTDGYNYYGPVAFGVHVDQHNLVMIPVDEATNSFRILNGNDGGVGISDDGGVTWRETDQSGYNTTQFYGVDKNNGTNEYIGGTQDNGTWQSNPGEDASALTAYKDRVGGDGFEAAWHYTDPLKMIGGSQYNTLYRTIDGWQTREAASVGFDDWSNSSNSPFISKVAESNSDPDLVFTISRAGVWRSDNFAKDWTLSPIADGDLSSGGYFSYAQVEISIADPQVVWAGAYMSNSGSILVSKDGGLTFNTTSNYANLGLVSGIATHPTDPATAYVLFSISGAPKILKTTNYGESWEDISGFSGSTSSSGFPDVAVYDLVVMPYNTDIIWAGTEIGLFVSNDGGSSWIYSNNGFPAVAIWDMKIVNDQVVVGTHGRGIWSVTLPELSNYTPPAATLSPRLNSTNLALDGVTLNVSLRSVYDSTVVMVNGTAEKTVLSTSVTDMVIPIETAQTGNLDVQLVSFKDGKQYKSSTKSVFNATLLAPRNGYVTDFSSNAEDFFSNNMTVEVATGFTNEALNTPHPYEENVPDYIALVRVPIVVASEDALLKYDDVAIVEPGDPGSVFGDSDFWDYAIVEGFDGTEWKPLLDGYDASANGNWLDAYNSGSSGNSSMFVSHTINLLDFFNAGDTVLIRFRLFTDQYTTGWGWLIDNVSIQEQLVDVNTDYVPTTFALNQNYPNPFNPSTIISFSVPKLADVALEVYSITGELVKVLMKGNLNAGSYEAKFNASQLSSGVYFYRLTAGDFVQTKKMMLIK